MSLIALEVAEKATNCARVVLAMIRASVVLPEPGGPQKIIDGMRSVSIALRRKRPGASSSLRPTTSSSVLGRTRSGSGASFGVLGSGGVVSKRVMGERNYAADARRDKLRAWVYDKLSACRPRGRSSAEQAEIDVAAGDHQRDWSARFDLSGEERGESEGGGRLDDQLRAVHRELHRLEQDLVVHADDVLHALADDREVALADRERARAVGDRLRRIDRYDAAAPERPLSIVPGLRLDTIDVTALRRERSPGQQTAATEWSDDRRDLGPLLDDLQRGGAGAGDDVVMIERRDDRRSVFLRDLARDGVPRCRRDSRRHDLRAISLGGPHFHRDRALGHDDRRRDAEGVGGECDALGVVAGRERHDSAPALLRIELQQGVHRPADLERPGALQVLALQPHLHPRPFRERTAGQEGGAVDVGGDAEGGRANVVEGWCHPEVRRHRRSRNGLGGLRSSYGSFTVCAAQDDTLSILIFEELTRVSINSHKPKRTGTLVRPATTTEYPRTGHHRG